MLSKREKKAIERKTFAHCAGSMDTVRKSRNFTVRLRRMNVFFISKASKIFILNVLKAIQGYN